VLPGVTVEAGSPVLIEKSRTAVTDGGGQYRIEGLRPGTYAVTFTLTGFSIVKREGIELSGSFTATVNAEMRVGSHEETITVSAESPVVDVQSAKRQQTLTEDVISAIPTARVYHSIATLVTGVVLSGTQDVGGISGPATNTFSIHGGRSTEGRLQVDGLPVGAALGGSGVSFYVADIGNAQEVTFATSGGLGEAEVGGPVMNVVPRTGGNVFRGSFFVNGANDKMASSNYTSELQNAGLKAPNDLLKIWDVNAVFGGPIMKDRRWFFGGDRYQGNRKLVAGMYHNQNAGNPAAWTYVADPSRQVGRPLSNNAANVTVNLITPGTLYGDRITQFDFRIAKILRFGRTRTNVGLDLYNALNSAAVQTYNQAFVPGGAWLTPTLVLPSRFAKAGVQIDF